MTPILFPLAEYWWFYALFTAFVLGMLALDLGVFHRKAHAVTTREAFAWTAVWITLALAFAGGLWLYAGWKLPLDPRLAGLEYAALAKQTALEFLAGYVVEASLSIDNIFVFIVVLGYFAVPAALQHRVLFYGILGALVFRAVFISLGSVLMQFHALILVFGAFLILTGLKILFAPEKPIEPEKNPAIRLLRRLVPVTPQLDGTRFFTRVGGVWHATPLFVCLAFVEISDIVFAVDSVPAIFALTREPLVVFTSNAFAILGLRSMYFLLAGVMHKFRFLKYGLGIVLVFVGLKMVWLNEAFGGKFPISWSLVLIAAILGTSIAASLCIAPRRAPISR